MHAPIRDHFPCGSCNAYVSRETGCTHYRSRSQPTAPRRVRRPARAGKYDDLYSLMRLADSTLMRRILDAAASGGSVALGTKNERHAANHLVRTGLLSLAGRGADYAITENGRRIAAKVAELTPAPPAGGKPAPG